MTLPEFIGHHNGIRPKATRGRETDWLAFCELDVPTGRLWAGDPCGLAADCGHVTDVPPGRYVVEAKAVDFGRGERFVSRLRVRPPRAVVEAGSKSAATGTDSGAIGVADLWAAEAGKRQEGDDVYSRLGREVSEQCGIVSLVNGARVPYVGAGLHNGSARVLGLRAAGRVVGIEIEIVLPPKYEIES